MSGAVSHTNAPRRVLDAYYTPDVLARQLVGLLPIQSGDTALEPSAGGGAFVRALTHAGALVTACDANPNAAGLRQAAHSVVGDFIHTGQATLQPVEQTHAPRWVVGNPPYKDAQRHVEHALDVSGRHVAMLLRLGFLAGQKRGRELWELWPPRCVWVLSKRPSFTGGGTDSTDYGWIWWDKRHQGATTLEWLRPA